MGKLYLKLVAIQEVVNGLGKDAEGQSGKAVYPYLSGDKLLRHLRPKMNELKLILKQEVVSVEQTQVNIGNGAMLYGVTMKFTWVDAETGETDENIFFAAGANSYEKGVGSALTYGERYFLCKYFHIPTDKDDVDTHDYDSENTPQQSVPAPTPAPTPAPSPAPRQQTSILDQKPFNNEVAIEDLEDKVNSFKTAEDVKSYWNKVRETLNPEDRARLYKVVLAHPEVVKASKRK